MAKLTRGHDAFVARITSLEIGEQTSQAGKPYQAVSFELEFANGKRSEKPQKVPIQWQNEGTYNPNSPGGRFLDGAINALKAGGVDLDDADFDDQVLVGKVFRIARVPQANKDPTQEARTNPVPVEYLGTEFPARNQ